MDLHYSLDSLKKPDVAKIMAAAAICILSFIAIGILEKCAVG